jgi:hypothetical protein
MKWKNDVRQFRCKVRGEITRWLASDQQKIRVDVGLTVLDMRWAGSHARCIGGHDLASAETIKS